MWRKPKTNPTRPQIPELHSTGKIGINYYLLIITVFLKLYNINLNGRSEIRRNSAQASKVIRAFYFDILEKYHHYNCRHFDNLVIGLVMYFTSERHVPPLRYFIIRH